MNELRNTFKELYETIPEWFRQPLFDAVNSVEETNEDHVIAPLSTLITRLGNVFNTHEAVNQYMTDPNTRNSVTRKFFFPHTLPHNLYPEDREIYTYPSLGSLDVLELKPATAISVPILAPRIDSFFSYDVQERISMMDNQAQDPLKAQAPSAIPQQ